MLISTEKGIDNTDRFRRVFSDNLVDLYIDGVLFFRKMREGPESVDHLVRCLKNDVIPFSDIYGSYTVVRRRIEVGIDDAIKSLVSFNKRHSVMR